MKNKGLTLSVILRQRAQTTARDSEIFKCLKSSAAATAIHTVISRGRRLGIT